MCSIRICQQNWNGCLAKLRGECKGIFKIMQAFDVFDLPVSATAASGNVEVVEEGISGTLVQPGDGGEMAQALLGYLDAPACMAGHGGDARRHAEQCYSIPAMAEAYARVYDQTLKRRQTA